MVNQNYLLENIYYIAFIILTLILAIVAIKTYCFQAKRTSSLFCKIFILPDDLGKFEQLICLEVYNHGNTPAENVKISLNGCELATVNFIRPADSAVLPVGQVLRMIGCNRVIIQDTEITEGTTIPVVISVNGGTTDEKQLQASSLFLHSNVVHNENERIARATEGINRTLEKSLDSHFIGPGHSTFRDESYRSAENIAKNK